MRLLLLLLIVCLVAPSFEWRRRRRRRWIRVRVSKVIKGAAIAAKIAPLIGKREIQTDDLPTEDDEENIGQSEAEGLFTARDAETLNELEKEYNESE